MSEKNQYVGYVLNVFISSMHVFKCIIIVLYSGVIINTESNCMSAVLRYLFERRIECVRFQAHLLRFRWAIRSSLLNRFGQSTTCLLYTSPSPRD